MQSEDDQQKDNQEGEAYTGATRRLTPIPQIIDKRTSSEPRCPKCGAAMEQGWVPDVAQGIVALPQWIAGRPRRRPWIGGYSVSAAKRRHIVTMRCTGCSYLESYAP